MSSAGDASTDRRIIEIGYDFGLIRPSVSVSHRFEVRNDTAFAWKLKKIHTSCACTVASCSARAFEPGKTETVELLYHAAPKSADDKRSVIVEFEEDEAPRIRLSVRANVRNPMTPSVNELVLADVGESLDAECHFRVANYTVEDWPSLNIQTSTPWLQASSHLLDGQDVTDDDGFRQLWRIDVTITGQGLPSGWHAGELKVVGGKEADLATTVPVRLRIAPLVAAVPPRFFFGMIGGPQDAHCTVKLRFQNSVVPTDEGAIRIEHDFGKKLTVHCGARSGNVWTLIATVNGENGEERLDGVVRVCFEDRRLPALSIPIMAMKRNP